MSKLESEQQQYLVELIDRARESLEEVRLSISQTQGAPAFKLSHALEIMANLIYELGIYEGLAQKEES